MNRISRAVAVILIVLGCIISVLVQTPQSALTVPPPVQVSPGGGGDFAEKFNLGRHFQELGVEGSIAIYDLNSAIGFINTTRSVTRQLFYLHLHLRFSTL
jgi:beta-lactamase class D